MWPDETHHSSGTDESVPVPWRHHGTSRKYENHVATLHFLACSVKRLSCQVDLRCNANFSSFIHSFSTNKYKTYPLQKSAFLPIFLCWELVSMPFKSEIHAKLVIFSLILIYLMEYLSARNIYPQGPSPWEFELSPIFKFKTTQNSIKSSQRPETHPSRPPLSRRFEAENRLFIFSVRLG